MMKRFAAILLSFVLLDRTRFLQRGRPRALILPL